MSDEDDLEDFETDQDDLEREDDEKETEEWEDYRKEGEESEDWISTPLTEDMMKEGLSLLCKTGNGLAHAYVKLEIKDREPHPHGDRFGSPKTDQPAHAGASGEPAE